MTLHYPIPGPLTLLTSSLPHSNAINGTNVYVIYAQTPKFSITGDSCTDPVATTTAATCAAATVTQTVTVRGNSSSTTPAAALVYASSPTGSPSSTFEGNCPSTIGWSGNYSHPVTLTSTPHAGRGLATAAPTAGTDAVNTVPALTSTRNWNTTMVVPTTSAGAVPTATGASSLTGAEKVVKTGHCSKKRQSRKRHSDGGRRSPFPRRK